MQFRDLKRQYNALKGDIDNAVQEVASSGAFIMGPQVRELERQMAAYVGVKHCLSCANGTDALTLALKAWGIGPGRRSVRAGLYLLLLRRSRVARRSDSRVRGCLRGDI